jgi:hypothetical protein
MALRADHCQRRLTKGVSSYGPEKTIMTNTFRLAVCRAGHLPINQALRAVRLPWAITKEKLI